MLALVVDTSAQIGHHHGHPLIGAMGLRPDH